MLQVTQDSIVSIRKFVTKRWPKKRVSGQDDLNPQYENCFIMISTLVDEHIAHYEYSNGKLEFHLEDNYYANAFNYGFYKYLRDNADTSNGDYRWHNWWGMRQGRLTYEHCIEDLLDLVDALTQMISYIDGLVNDYLRIVGQPSNNNIKEALVESQPDDVSNHLLICKNKQLPNPDKMEVCKLTPQVMCIKDLPFCHFEIPDYQRPYKWNSKHVNQLINDLIAFQEKKEYRLGTLVLHGNKIVDGQQRIVTLSLLFFVLYENFIANSSQDIPYNDFLQKIKLYWQRTTFKSPISIAHVRENLTCIRERKTDLDKKLLTFLMENCQFVVVRLPKISEAFQFFDSQNARGLIGLFLSMYRVNRWSKSYSGNRFTKDDIGVFKGISLKAKKFPFYLQHIICHYFVNDYVENKTRMIDENYMEYPFQLDQICVNGSRFFDMIRYYSSVYKQVRKSDTYEVISSHKHSAYKVISFLNTYPNRNRQGDKYTRELFDCMLLYYIDRFGFEEIDKIVWKFFKEVYSIRIEQHTVKLSTIDNYAMDGRMFKTIRDAHSPFDIINIPTYQLQKIADNVDESKDELLKLYKQ